MYRFASVVVVLTLAQLTFGQDKTAQPPTPAHPPECLIVTSAEGHRFRNSMIAGALTGGIGFAAGAAFSGGRYEYRDAFNLPPNEVKAKYKGPELQKLEQEGVHVIVVNKNDKTGSEMSSARSSCQSLIAPAAPATAAAPTATPMAPVVAAPATLAPATLAPAGLVPAAPPAAPAQTQPKAPVCLATMIDAKGNEVCTKYSDKQ
jgi:hypothetical protein